MSPKISKPSKKVLDRRVSNQRKRVPPHTVWSYKPKLKNEGAILNSMLGIYDISYYDDIINDVRCLITQLVRNHGFNDGSVRYKTIMNYTLQLIEGRNPDNPGWLATSERYRVPSQLGVNFTQLIANYFECTEELKPKYYQVILTILNIVRMVEGLTDVDLKSITDKSMPIDQELLDEFDTYVSKHLGVIDKIDSDINLFNVRFNVRRNGPNGVPKVESAIDEAVALLESKLSKPFKIICQELNCLYLFDYLAQLVVRSTNGQVTSDTKSDKSSTTRLRVLARIPDKGFKTRVVAIVDFWTQLILEPVRAHVQRVIEMKYGKTDFRKDQDLGVTKMVEFQKRCLVGDIINSNSNIRLDAKHLYFYDITSWTDRLHRDLQKITMKHLFTPRFAEAWAQLVVHCDWYFPALKSTVKYGQGQGMGTNGSFDIATLTDHLFINFLIDEKSSIKGLFPNNACYGKVGDDLWIYDPDDLIHKYYQKIHLPINLSKSKMYVNGNSIAEFCSRTFINGTDVSRISPKIISKSTDFRYIPLLLGICSSRGIQLDATSFKSLSNICKRDGESYFEKLQPWLISFLLISQYEQSSSMWNYLTPDYLLKGNWLTEGIAKQTLSDTKLACRLLIAHSIVQIIKNKEDLKDKLFDLVDAMDDYDDSITSLCDRGANLFDPQNSHCIEFLANAKIEYLTPKQIVVFGRYVDQRIAIHDKFVELNDKIAFSEDPKDIWEYAKELSIVSQRSCYDQGNINYNVDRVYGVQYKIVKTIESMNEDFTILYGLNQSQLRSLWQDIPYDSIADKWEGYLPILSVDDKPSL